MNNIETWCQNLPSSWIIAEVKYIFDIQLGKMLQTEEKFTSDKLVRYFKAQHIQWHSVTTEDLPEMWASPRDIIQYNVKNGDLLVCEGGEVGRSAILKNWKGEAIIQNALHRVRSSKNSVRFLEYVLRTIQSCGWFDVICNKATIAHFTKEKFAALRIPLPPIEVQQAIASFLDRKTAAIDALIAKKQRLIELLEENRSGLINQAVTKGLNPNAPMKDSGIPWVGEIPGHWQVKRARFIYCQLSRPPQQKDGVVTAFRDGQVTLRENRRAEGYTFAIKEVGYQGIRTGDLVIHSMDAFAGAIGVSESDGKCSPEYVICQPIIPGINNHYYAALLRWMAKQNYIYVICPSVRERAPRFRYSTFQDVWLPVPPAHEQEAIAKYIIDLPARLNPTLNKLRQQLEAIKEYRQSLITAAVTGKLDITQEEAA